VEYLAVRHEETYGDFTATYLLLVQAVKSWFYRRHALL